MSGIFDFFKNRGERKKYEQKYEQKKAKRETDKLIRDIKNRIKQLKNERQKIWEEAKEYRKNAQKRQSKQCLKNVQQIEAMIVQMENKRFIFETMKNKVMIASINQNFTRVTESLNKVFEMDVTSVRDIARKMEMAWGKQEEAGEIWKEVYEEEIENMDTKFEDEITPIDRMEKELDEELAEGEIAVEDEGHKKKINNEREKIDEIRKMVDGNK